MTMEAKGDCTCMPVKVIEDSLKDGASPYGSQSKECFQVDTNYIFNIQTSNCKKFKMNSLNVYYLSLQTQSMK